MDDCRDKELHFIFLFEQVLSKIDLMKEYGRP